MSATQLADVVSVIAKALVDDPDSVSVTESPDNRRVRLQLRVAQGDIGKVIGKDGRTAQSIRTVVSAAGHKLGCRAQLDILD